MNLKMKAKGKRQKAKTTGLSVVACCFAVFATLLFSCQSGSKKAEPAKQPATQGIAAFAFSEEMHNFGSLNAGEIVSYTFVFRNSGNKTLVIDRIDSGCGCLEVKIPEMSIDPGDEGRVEVIYNSAGEVGNQLKTITLFSNADQPEKQLIVRAAIKNEMIEINS